MAEIKTLPQRLISYEVSHAAQADVDEILVFCKTPSQLSDLFNRDLHVAIEHLRRWPYTGHRRRDLTKRDVCFWYFTPYYLVIHVQPEKFTIIAVLHGSRHIARILRKRLTSKSTK